MFIDVSSELSDQITVSAVLHFREECLIFKGEFLHFLSVPLFQVSNFFVAFALQRLDLGLKYLVLATRLIELLIGSLALFLLCLQFKPVTGFHILGNFHAEDVAVNRERQFVVHLFYLPLFGFNGSFHVSDPLLLRELNVLPCLHLLSETALSQCQPLTHSLVVLLMIFVQCTYLVPLCHLDVKLLLHDL